MQKLIFICSNTFVVSILLLSFYGYGLLFINQKLNLSIDKIFQQCLTLTIGMGVVIVILQFLGISGYINHGSSLIIVAIGLLCYVTLFLTGTQKNLWRNQLKACWNDKVKPINIGIALVLFLVIIRSMSPPTAFDEVMYHLPHAKEWVTSGYITTDEWLRYAYFPFNFELLYAFCLTLHNELLTHFLHSAMGVLLLIGTYRIAKTHFNQVTAIIAVIMLYFCMQSLLGTAYIDLALSVFISFSFYYLYLGFTQSNIKIFYISAFLLGLALGTKYQAFIFVIPFGLVIFYKERNIVKLLKISFFFLLPCAFWYVRNYWLIGNPVEPFGGSIFGYHSWNAEDMQGQLDDLKNASNWPRYYLWPALGSLFFYRQLPKIGKSMVVLSIYTVLIWYFTSHYTRYLLPIYPCISILSAFTICFLVRKIYCVPLYRGINYSIILALAISSYATVKIIEKWSKIVPTAKEHYQYLKHKIDAYDVIVYLQEHPNYKVLQFHLEDTYYYLPRGTRGDHFGKGRYRDFVNLDAKSLANYMQSLNVNAILLSDNREGDKIYNKENFNQFFALVIQKDDGRLYRLVDTK